MCLHNKRGYGCVTIIQYDITMCVYIPCTKNEKTMKRKIKAIGIILGVTALIAVAYFGVSQLIENHITSESVGIPVFSSTLATGIHK